MDDLLAMIDPYDSIILMSEVATSCDIAEFVELNVILSSFSVN